MKWPGRLLFLMSIAVLMGGWFHGFKPTPPCDLVVCAEAYSVQRSYKTSYVGPLFQLNNGSTTLDVGQTASGAANMTTWSAFCSGVPANCKYSKIYAQIQGSANDLIPATFNAPSGPNCSAGGALVCAAPFAIDGANWLPIINTVAPQEYALPADGPAIGIPGGNNPASIIYDGRFVNSTYCCGVFGFSHAYNTSNVKGTDFIIVVAFGQAGAGLTNCATASTYCIGLDEEVVVDTGDYGSSIINVIASVTFDPGTNTVTGMANGNALFSRSPPASSPSTLAPGNSIHFGGGGDLSQPAPAIMRGGLITNTTLTTVQQQTVFKNLQAFSSPNAYP